MEHSDLVAEMSQVEHLTTQERLHLARRRRIHQLKIWAQREKEWMRNRIKKEKSTKRNIYFSDSVMLLEAAARNDIDEVRRLLQKNVTPDATNEDGLTALHQCCIDNNETMMKLLLDHGANVNAEDSEKWTPLHAAATCGNLNLVRILIQRGANLLAVNGDGNMPYDICEDERTLDAIESEMAARGVTQQLIDDTRAHTERQMLLDVIDYHNDGGDLDQPRDHQGATLLHIASANGYTKVVEYLLEARANVDPVDVDLWRPTHAAACWGHLEVLELLVQYGADLNARNKHDETPANICEDSEMRARLTLLAAEQEDARRRATRLSRPQPRRSSSTASTARVRSVRRTSVREKQLAAKQDARGEAKMRESFDADQGFSNGLENDQNAMNQIRNGDLPHKRLSNDSTASNQSYESSEYGQIKPTYKRPSQDENYYSKYNYNATSYAQPKEYEVPNGVRKAPEGQDNECLVDEDQTDSRRDSGSIPASNSAHYTTDNNGKINVHVTVMINAGTLADLKKQRSQIRTNGSPVEQNSLASTNNPSLHSVSTDGAIAAMENMPVQLNPLSLSPSSGTVPRFTGNTSEFVGDTKQRKCCIIM